MLAAVPSCLLIIYPTVTEIIIHVVCFALKLKLTIYLAVFQQSQLHT